LSERQQLSARRADVFKPAYSTFFPTSEYDPTVVEFAEANLSVGMAKVYQSQ